MEMTILKTEVFNFLNGKFQCMHFLCEDELKIGPQIQGFLSKNHHFHLYLCTNILLMKGGAHLFGHEHLFE